MASAHINLSAGTQTAKNGELRSFIGNLQHTQDDANRLKAIFDQAALGGDWTALGELLGVSATDAETIYNLLGSVVTEVNGTFISQFLSRCG